MHEQAYGPTQTSLVSRQKNMLHSLVELTNVAITNEHGMIAQDRGMPPPTDTRRTVWGRGGGRLSPWKTA